MGLRSLLFSAVVGVAALGACSYAPAAQARSSFSVTIGSPAPYYRGNYAGNHGNRYGNNYRGYQRGQHRPGYVLVPGHWTPTYRGRVWIPGQYVQARGHRNAGYGYVPRRVYRQVPRGHHPRNHGRPRGW